jgi:hypothetical protein
MKTKNITTVTCTRDRHHQLLETMNYVEKIDGLKVHIILDWGSKNQLILEDTQKSKKQIYIAPNENRWWLTRAYNTSFFLVETEYVLKLDADVKFNYKKFNNLDYSNYDLIIFFDKPNDPGNFLIKKNLLKKINGFNEYMWEWGWSDHDLVNRAKINTKKNKVLEVYGFIDKIPHDNSTRSIVSKSTIYKKKDLFYYSLIKSHNDVNAYLSKKQIWSNKNNLSYEVTDNLINLKHFYSIKDLNLFLRASYKYKFLKQFFKIYKLKNRGQKYFLPIICFVLPNIILESISLQLYPKKTKI